MTGYDGMMLIAKIIPLLFVFLYGACLGSLINVIAYRMPRGIGIVTPPSACPSCKTRLSWRDNIPIFGWVLLRGRCRYCRTKISPEYPLVELFTACLLALLYAIWYVLPPGAGVLGVEVGTLRPEWAMSDSWNAWPQHTWSICVVVLMLVASLIAMTLCDAKTFTIPLMLPWFASAVALLFHPLGAWAVEASRWGGLPRTAPGEVWSIPTGNWLWLGAGVGGVLGLAFSMVLVQTGLLRRSFADYDQWEQGERAKRATMAPAVAPTEPGGTGSEGEGAAADSASAQAEAEAAQAEVAGAERASSETPALVPSGADPEMWIQYPHARREMLRELLFLAPCLALMFVGVRVAWGLAGPWRVDASGGVFSEVHQPLWAQVLGGVLVGYLVGGGVVWLVRIIGSLAFGKEAMGLGDVHLMAAVGACLGWIDTTLAFFGAAFVGLGWAILGRLAGGTMARQLPYGPFLAVSTVLVLLFKPGIEAGLSALLRMPVNLP